MSDELPIFVPPLFPKQMEAYNCKGRYQLLTGPRWSSKTVAVVHKLMKHAWETPEGMIAMFTKSQKNAKSGVWNDMVKGDKSALEIWRNAGLASPRADFEVTVEPKVDGTTRVHHFQIRNYWGSESRIELHSLDYDGDVEKAMFGTRFTCIYFSELQYFLDPSVFDTTKQQLRSLSPLDYDKFLWIADTNPPRSGPDHFAFKLWFQQLNPEKWPMPKGEVIDPVYAAQFKRIDFTLGDNPSLDPRQIHDLKMTYEHDPEEFDRLFLGLWTHGGGKDTKHFAMAFKPEIHVLGNIDHPDESEWEVINPKTDCFKLYSGWDIGDVNHAVILLQKRVMENGLSAWDVLDEIVSIGETLTTESLTEMVLEKRAILEKQLGRDVEWADWSDTSAFTASSKGPDKMDALIVERASDATIQLQAATNCKKPNGVQHRVRLIRRLLSENRLFISAHCVNTIAMLKGLPRGHKVSDYVPRGNKHKHCFDALSYAIFMEMLGELELGDNPNQPDVGGRMVSV